MRWLKMNQYMHQFKWWKCHLNATGNKGQLTKLTEHEVGSKKAIMEGGCTSSHEKEIKHITARI